MNSKESDRALPLDNPLSKLLGEKGPLAQNLASFEARRAQQEMVAAVYQCYRSDGVALIEAGTGTGKTMAYLLPALYWASRRKEKTLISTNRINLQEQIIEKDFPLLARALGIELKVVLVKGMGNYLCLKKLHETLDQAPLLHLEERQVLLGIEHWASETNEGSRSSLPLAVEPSCWHKVAAENDSCNREDCRYYRSCFFFRARKEAQDAHILVSNHHLLFTDIAQRAEKDNYKNLAVLPPYERVIIDEAHNIEEIATDHLARRSHLLEMRYLLGALQNSGGNGRPQGKVILLKNRLAKAWGATPVDPDEALLLGTIDKQLLGESMNLYDLAKELFEWLEWFCEEKQSQKEETIKKIRLKNDHYSERKWQDELVPICNAFYRQARSYCALIEGVVRRCREELEQPLVESIKNLLSDLSTLSDKLLRSAQITHNCITTPVPAACVRWVELQQGRQFLNVILNEADLQIDELLQKSLFKPFRSAVLCSATLTTSEEFAFLRQRLGLACEKTIDKSIKEHLFASPYDHEKQAMLAVPTDLPLPHEEGYLEACCKLLLPLLTKSQGGAFLLFTSYSHLNYCYKALSEALKAAHLLPLMQGQVGRSQLLQQFKESGKAVLFATDSFWEGVDVAGRALRLVVIAKLPFKVPSEPLIEARCEAIEKSKQSSFQEYLLPLAIVKFKQGVGRLIRRKDDFGAIVCLDRRLIEKSYGKLFLKSIPACQTLFAPSKELLKGLEPYVAVL